MKHSYSSGAEKRRKKEVIKKNVAKLPKVISFFPQTPTVSAALTEAAAAPLPCPSDKGMSLLTALGNDDNVKVSVACEHEQHTDANSTQGFLLIIWTPLSASKAALIIIIWIMSAVSLLREGPFK